MNHEPTSAKGWLNRRKLADMRRDEDVDAERIAIRRERQRIYDEQAESDRLAAEAHESSLRAEECRCTACGGAGRLTVPNAMRLVKALHAFGFHDHVVTPKEIAALAAVAKGDPVPPGCVAVTFSYGSISPAPGRDALPEPAVTIEAVEQPKPAKPTKGPKPSEDQFLPDGALIEI